jgi:phosphatidylglycerol:prolipoprotein diacylglycerol transferase
VLTLFRSLFAPPRHLILLLLALWLGLGLSEKQAEKHGISKDAVNTIVSFGVLGFMFGGRLLFALANFAAFRKNPLSIFSFNIDLFGYTGGLLSAIVIGFIYGWRRRVPLWSTLDALTPFFAVASIGLALSHLAAGTAFGKPTTVPWGMELWNATRHPTQIYELIASVVIFCLIWSRKSNIQEGLDFLMFASLTAGARLWLEAYRGDSTLVFGGVRLAQILAWFVLAIAFFLIGARNRTDAIR